MTPWFLALGLLAGSVLAGGLAVAVRRRDQRRADQAARIREVVDFHLGRGPDADRRLAAALREHPYEREEGDPTC